METRKRISKYYQERTDRSNNVDHLRNTSNSQTGKRKQTNTLIVQAFLWEGLNIPRNHPPLITPGIETSEIPISKKKTLQQPYLAKIAHNVILPQLCDDAIVICTDASCKNEKHIAAYNLPKLHIKQKNEKLRYRYRVSKSPYPGLSATLAFKAIK